MATSSSLARAPSWDKVSVSRPWDKIVEDNIATLPEPALRRLRSVLSSATYSSCHQMIKELVKKHNETRSMKAVGFLDSFLLTLKQFESAITNITQGMGAMGVNPAMLVWGLLQLPIEMAITATETSETILDLLGQFSRTLPQFEEFMDQYPSSERLQSLLAQVYDTYVKFCVTAVQYLTHRSQATSIFIPSTRRAKFQAEFTKLISTLQSQNEEFMRQTFLNGAQVQNSIAHIVSNIQRSSLPNTQRAPEVEFPIFRVPYSTNPRFTAREQELQTLRGELEKKPGRGPTSCVIHGLGGLGKTQLAIEYAHRFRENYDAVFWLSAETEFELAKDYADIARKLGLTDNLADQNRCAEYVRDWLNGTDKRWLLIFDNIETSSTLRKYWGLSAVGGQAIFTTQNRAIANDSSAIISQLHLQGMSPDQGATFLLNGLNKEEKDREVAKQVSMSVSGLPLALALIVGFMQGVDDDCELSDFVDEFLAKQDSFEVWASGEGISMSQYSKSMLTVFSMAINNMPSDSRDFIDMLSLLSPDSIPEPMLLGGHLSAWKKPRYIGAKRHLRSRYLIDSETVQHQKVLRVHRSVHNYILHELRKDDARFRKIFAQAQDMIRKVFPRQNLWMNPVNHDWIEYEKYMPHIWSLWKVFSDANPPLKGSEEFVSMLCDAGNYLWEQERRDDGLAMLQTAKAVFESISPSHDTRDDKEYAKTLCLMACLLCGGGITGRSEGREYFGQVLELRKQHFAMIPRDMVSNGDRFLLANGFNDFACGLLHDSSYWEAESPLREALALKRACGTEDKFKAEFAEAFKNISYVLLAKDQCQDAVTNMRRATELALDVYRESSAAYQLHLFHLGCVLYTSGRIEESLQIHQKVMRSRKDQVFGEHHEHTLNSYYAVGFIDWKTNRLLDARANLQHVAASAQSAKWPTVNLTRATFALSQVMIALGNTLEGADMESKARETLRVLLENHRPDLLHDYLNSSTQDVMRFFDHIVSLHAGRFSLLTTLQESSIPEDVAELGAVEVVGAVGP